MRIQELEIDRFGVWQDISLPLNSQGLTVFYGPNEAGKSTLMRFVRGVLYGYNPRDERTGGPDPKPLSCAGSLRIEHEGTEYRLRRLSQSGSRGKLEINGRSTTDADPQLQRILGGASESLFENIFAIGLHELQQLATLNGEEVARHIYGLSLGPDGERILRAQSDLDSQSQRLLATDQRTGEVLDLMKRLEQLDQQLERQDLPAERYNGILGQHKQVESSIDVLKRRQATLQQNLRGMLFVHRAWGPWNRQRELRRLLEQSRGTNAGRPEMLDRYDQLDQELKELERRRDGILHESRRLMKQADAIVLRPELEEQACEIKHLHGRLEEMRGLERGGRNPANSPQTPLPSEIQKLLSQFSPPWDVARLRGIEVRPGMLQDLLGGLEKLRSASRNRVRAIRRYKSLSNKVKRHQQRWSDHLVRWGSQSPSQVRQHAQQRLAELEEIRELRLQREHLSRIVRMTDTGDSRRLQPVSELLRLFLLLFSIAGVCLLGGGLYAGMHHYEGIVAGGPIAWVAGGCLFLLGVSALAISRTLRHQAKILDPNSGDSTLERQRLNRDLERVNQALNRLTRKDALRPPLSHAVPLAGDPVTISEDDVIRQVRIELEDIEAYDAALRRLEHDQRAQSALRHSLQSMQREVSARRREWSELLHRLGLDETLKTGEAFQSAGRLLEARRLYDDWSRSQSNDGYERRQLEDFRRRCEQLGETLHGRGYRSRDMQADVTSWEQELRRQTGLRRERADLRKQARERQAAAATHEEKLAWLRDQRSAVLAESGCRNREELVIQLKTFQRVEELERQSHDAKRELDRISQSEPELAIVEDDLARFDPAQHEKQVSQIRRDLEGVDQELRGHYENLGLHKRELRAIEDDRSNASLRYERAQVVEALRDATQRWGAISLADGLVGKLRERVERSKQPQLLQHAADFLRRLTCGKYRNVWTPLGERRLVIDDDGGHSLRIEQLSSGTREQVFLAIRMAMIRTLASQGTVLPMVLDDVTVNFDQTRTEAAVSTLADLAEQGQQILLFTCHLHLSHIFQNQGIEPVWLPGLRTNTNVTVDSRL